MYRATPETDLRITPEGRACAQKHLSRIRAGWDAEKAQKRAEADRQAMEKQKAKMRRQLDALAVSARPQPKHRKAA